jgi:hypothetical protein
MVLNMILMIMHGTLQNISGRRAAQGYQQLPIMRFILEAKPVAHTAFLRGICSLPCNFIQDIPFVKFLKPPAV